MFFLIILAGWSPSVLETSNMTPQVFDPNSWLQMNPFMPTPDFLRTPHRSQDLSMTADSDANTEKSNVSFISLISEECFFFSSIKCHAAFAYEMLPVE